MKPITAALSAFARPSKFAFVAAIASACARLAVPACSAGSARNGPLLPTAPRSGRTSTGTACGSIRAAPSGARLSWRSGGERSNATGSTKRAALGETTGTAVPVVCARTGGTAPHSDSSAMLQTSSRWFIESLLDQARSARAINLGGPSALFQFDLGMRALCRRRLDIEEAPGVAHERVAPEVLHPRLREVGHDAVRMHFVRHVGHHHVLRLAHQRVAFGAVGQPALALEQAVEGGQRKARIVGLVAVRPVGDAQEESAVG